MIIDHLLARLAALRGTAPAHALPVSLPREVEILVKSVACPFSVSGVELRSYSMDRSRSLDTGALAVTSHIPPLPVCGLNTLGRGLMTAARTAKCARALGATVHSRNDCARDRLAITRPGVTNGSRCRSRDRRRSHDHSPLLSDRSRSGKRSWRPGQGCWDRGEAVVASRDRGNSGSTVEPAPAVAGDSIPLSTSSFPDLVRLFLSLLGPLTQWDATIGSLFSAAGVIGAGVLGR